MVLNEQMKTLLLCLFIPSVLLALKGIPDLLPQLELR